MLYLDLQHLFKRFGAFNAVQDVSLQIHQGEFISLLGPSGCGKTTILRILAGFERPSGGTIRLEGQDITLIPANRRDMGMVFQSYSLFPHMTAAQNIAFGLRVKKMSKPQQRMRAQEMLDLVGLGEMGDRYPHQLSGGQQQRIALARALAIEPRVLLLDEPLSALDAKVRLQLRNEIRRIQQQLGITTLFVTHDQEEALSISDRVVVMAQGRIDQEGTPEEIYLSPKTPFTASFIGAMNQISGRWSLAHHRVWLASHPDTNLPDEFLQTQPVDLPDGTPVLVLVRPETIHVLPSEVTPPPDMNVLSGLIASRVFLGAVMRLSVLVGDFYLNVDVPTGEAEQFQSGQVVQLCFAPDQCRVLTTEPVVVPPSALATQDTPKKVTFKI